MDFGSLNNYFVFTKDELVKIKNTLTKEEVTSLEEVLKDCKEDFALSKRSVIYTKGDLTDYNPKDYVSLSPYWWPDPEKEDGLPYIRRDGEVNPITLGYDKANLKKFGLDIFHLCLLYYLTENKEYYNLFKEKVNYYLLDEVTGMNPNMYHAQTIRGIDDGRCYGIIEYSANFTIAFNLINELYQMGLIEDSFKNEMNVWVKGLLHYLNETPRGIQEREGTNNHAIYWDFGAIILCDFLGDNTLIEELYTRVVNKRVMMQINEEGGMPRELARTRSKHYSVMGFKGILSFAIIAKKYGFDMWSNDTYKAKLHKAVDYLYDGLIFKTREWTYKQITKEDSVFFLGIMNEARKNLGDKYDRFDLIDKDSVENEVAYLLGRVIFN